MRTRLRLADLGHSIQEFRKEGRERERKQGKCTDKAERRERSGSACLRCSNEHDEVRLDGANGLLAVAFPGVCPNCANKPCAIGGISEFHSLPSVLQGAVEAASRAF